MSNPINADSEGDGYYDNEELGWETDVCGSEHPPYHAHPTAIGAGDREHR